LERAEQMNPPIATLADITLIKMVLSGRTECFAVLMNRYLPMVRRRIGSIAPNIADVEDLSQEVFFKTWQHLSTFREESSFGTWVTRVAINEALTLCRRNHSRPNCQTMEDLDTFASAIDSPLQCLARREARQMLHCAIAKLPVIYRRVLILRDFEQFSIEEVARLVRSTVPAVKTRLSRARVMLLRLIAEPTCPALAQQTPRRGAIQWGTANALRGGMDLDITKRCKENGIWILDLRGPLVVGDPAAFLRRAIVTMGEVGSRNVILNFEGVSEIDADGLGALVFCYVRVARLHGMLKLLNLSPSHLSAIAAAKLATVFEVFADEQDATNSFSSDRVVRHWDVLQWTQNR